MSSVSFMSTMCPFFIEFRVPAMRTICPFYWGPSYGPLVLESALYIYRRNQIKFICLKYIMDTYLSFVYQFTLKNKFWFFILKSFILQSKVFSRKSECHSLLSCFKRKSKKKVYAWLMSIYLQDSTGSPNVSGFETHGEMKDILSAVSELSLQASVSILPYI